jgi:hypothetical protein
LIRDHIEAVQTLLGGLRSYVTRAPADAALPYVVVYPTQGNPKSLTLTGEPDWRTWPFRTVCVGATWDQAALAAELVEARLLNHTPVVENRVTSPIRKDVSVGIDRNENVQPPLFEARDLWSFDSFAL